jgi:hypothetical protein
MLLLLTTPQHGEKKTTGKTIRETGTKRVKTRMYRRVKSEESSEEVGREEAPSYRSRNEKLTGKRIIILTEFPCFWPSVKNLKDLKVFPN